MPRQLQFSIAPVIWPRFIYFTLHVHFPRFYVQFVWFSEPFQSPFPNLGSGDWNFCMHPIMEHMEKSSSENGSSIIIYNTGTSNTPKSLSITLATVPQLSFCFDLQIAFAEQAVASVLHLLWSDHYYHYRFHYFHPANVPPIQSCWCAHLHMRWWRWAQSWLASTSNMQSQ